MSQKTVLLVEDEPLIADIVGAFLNEYDFEVVVARSGDEAASLIDSGPAFAALVTDINMPGLLSGWDVARRARKRAPWIPVVYITGHAASDWDSEGVPRSHVFPKPFLPEHVAQRVQGLVNG